MIWAALLCVLSLQSCRRDSNEGGSDAQLMISLYVPGATMTRAETGTVNPLEDELRITSLQIWAFISDDGTLISYKCFYADLDKAGISNANITRFALPLTNEMFARLTSANRPKVDVYAVANAFSAILDAPDENTSREALDQVVINRIGGNSPLTMSVPAAGLPMSGVLKSADVTGGYPVLNITTLKLTRAVSKIRFVFCQQGTTDDDTNSAVPVNDACQITGIQFDGTANGKDCQISTTERLFTDQSFCLGDEPEYTPLNAPIMGANGDALIPNANLSIVTDPESLFFRGTGNETETAQEYESRLGAAISSASQVGPIYLRETDKTISGTITYRTSAEGEDQTARFSMAADDIFSRNHTWIVYACFVEETMKLKLKTVVVPWEWTGYPVDFTTGTVNVVRRFTVFETPVPTFKKVQTTDGFYDVSFWHTVSIEGQSVDNTITGDIIIATPVLGTLHVIPVPGTLGSVQLSNAFIVEPQTATIYPNYETDGRIEHCQIPISIKCNKEAGTDAQLEGNYIDLHFSVETPGGQFIDLGSESIDYYRFILSSSWNK